MERSNDSGNTGKILGALLVGAAVGGVLGVFLAPHKGSRTYKNLMKGARHLSDDLKSRVNEEVAVLRIKVEGLESLAKEKISELISVRSPKSEQLTIK